MDGLRTGHGGYMLQSLVLSIIDCCTCDSLSSISRQTDPGGVRVCMMCAWLMLCLLWHPNYCFQSSFLSRVDLFCGVVYIRVPKYILGLRRCHHALEHQRSVYRWQCCYARMNDTVSTILFGNNYKVTYMGIAVLSLFLVPICIWGCYLSLVVFIPFSNFFSSKFFHLSTFFFIHLFVRLLFAVSSS